MDTRKDMSTEMDTERTYQQIATEMDTVYNRTHLQTAAKEMNIRVDGSIQTATAKDAREITRQYLYSTVCLQKSSDNSGQINSRGN
jgi:hypothetical protein